MALSAVVFDLDYTLAVVRRDRATLLAEAAATADVPVDFSREEYGAAHQRAHAHETRAPIFADLLGGNDDGEALAEAYRTAIADDLEPIDDAETLIADLRERYKVGLLTNGPVLAQRDKLATLGWEGLFDAAVITGELEAGKPDRGAFEAILDALDVAPERAVYVGDSIEADVVGASEAGLFVVQVCYPGGPDPDPRADVHVDRAALTERLPAIVRELD
ncbi:HAD family hydrolase [Halalkalicoccus ordinarius]|uniref:HAD family hydrolase n=1 Tax=Halalkalicoccus ordinarius TaxID=3116651 RepID=UPI00300F06FB